MFIDAYHSPQGPLKWMNAEDKQKIHDEIDVKMEELENSGLSRNELLHDLANEGLPLTEDPVFQFLKWSRLAREMLLKPGQIFSVESVIEIALRQDLGIDTSLVSNQKNFKLEKHNNLSQKKYSLKFVDNNPLLDPEAYYDNLNMHKKRKFELIDMMEKPPTFINKPLSRDELHRKFRLKIRKKDMKWNKPELLVKFLNDSGKIMNMYQTRLARTVQRKMANEVVSARNMQLLPHEGLVKPTDKIPYKFQSFEKKVVDPLTGKIYRKSEINEQDVDDIYNTPNDYQVNENEEADPEKMKQIKSINLDGFNGFVSSKIQMRWMEAQIHLVN